MEYEREVKSLDKKPNPGDVLYKDLFATRDRDQTFAIISDGCTIILKNADRLVKDAKLLKDGGGYVSASFLAFAAREETAKSHILLDACRLDFPVTIMYSSGFVRPFTTMLLSMHTIKY